MATVYKNRYVSDIPLKRPQETFVDEPSALDEVSLNDLVLDLANDVKDINSLHTFHAVAVFKATLEDLIRLGANKSALREFRRRRLEANSIDLDALQCQIYNETNKSESASDSGDGDETATAGGEDGSSPNLLSPASGSPQLGELGPSGSCSNRNEPRFVNVASVDAVPTSAVEQLAVTQTSHENSSCGSLNSVTQEPERACPEWEETCIPIELLVKTTSLDVVESPITAHSTDRLQEEILFHMSPKIRQQAGRLLKCFSLAKAPPITIEQFLTRIKTYSPSISVSVYTHSAFMMYKLCVLFDVVELTPLNVYRFILASLRCSTKKLEDVHQRQKSFATVGGVALKELSKIEVSFLYLSNFKMVVSEFHLNQFLTQEFVALRNFCDSLQPVCEPEPTVMALQTGENNEC